MTTSLHQTQADFYVCDKKYVGFIAGMGSGKTFLLVVHCLDQALSISGATLAVYFPTYKHFTTTLMPEFDTHLSRLSQRVNVPYQWNKTDKILYVGRSKVLFRTMEEPQLIVGYQTLHSYYDEFDVIKRESMDEVWIKSIGRNRQACFDDQGKRITNRFFLFSTPEGFGWAYDFFEHPRDDMKHHVKYFRTSTDENIDYVGTEYIENIQQNYSPQRAKAYRHALWTNFVGGLVYNSFHREKNATHREVMPYDTLHIGIDFNRNKMAAVVCVFEDQKIYIVDEFYGSEKTEDLAQQIKKRYPQHSINVYPDSTGRKYTTNSNQSDIDILNNHFYPQVFVNHNPSIIDRVEKVNRLLCNGRGKRRCLINTNKTPLLTRCLESQVYAKSTRLPDKQHDTDHLPDALGYYLFKVDFLPASREIAYVV